jgi:F-type H+-transporting ATPase subunit epsilon
VAEATHTTDPGQADRGTTGSGGPGHARQLTVEIRSPDGPIWTGAAESVTVPGSKGSMGILPRHAPLMSSLDVGLTRVREPGGKEHRFITGGGFVEVHRQRVLVLVDFGDRPEAVDTERARAARDRAIARLRPPQEAVDTTRAEAALARALQRLKYAGQPRV